ncbi:hypothetical protein [Phaeodactylibacter xiamenensis]|uniref:hypothetical protein n=1 Tax=Phaeodactylibacter xiamenensis TaxID=1524460 RepID=UPI0024A8FB20|nr:hypothetical protein [Phaeodactylibacter xiamenensis]
MMKAFKILFLALFALVSTQSAGQQQLFLNQTGGAPPTAGLLDQYKGAAFAAAPDVLLYSTYSATDDIAGSLTNGQVGQWSVAVFRDFDDAIKSFTPAEVADGTANTWVQELGPSDGFVTRFYDQSVTALDVSNLNHADQSDPTKMPKLFDSSTGLVVENGKAALLFSGNQWLKSVFASSISPVSGFLVVNHIPGTFALDDNDEINNNSLVALSNTQIRLWSGTTSVQACFSDIPAGLIDNQVLSSFISNGASSKLRTNAQYEGVPSDASGTVRTMSGCTLGAAGTNVAALNGGNIALCVLYGSNKTSDLAAIETAINNEYNIYP